MEFDKNKILTCVTGSSDLIGKKGWFGDSIVELARKYRDNDPQMLQAFDSSSVYPFKSSWGYGPSTLFYPASEPTYRPFKNTEEFKPYRDEWICYNGITFKVDGYNYRGIFMAEKITYWDTAFKLYRFEKGDTPFGIKEEA